MLLKEDNVDTLKNIGIKFDETYIAKHGDIVDSESYMKHSRESLPHIYNLLKNGTHKINNTYSISLKTLSAGTKIQTLNKDDLPISITFDKDIVIPVLRDSLTVWMSHTPMEVFTCDKGIRIAKGKVAMGGLGLGYMAYKILLKEDIEHLTIYETNQDIIDSIGKELFSALPDKLARKLTIINESAYSIQDDKFDTVLIDIYPAYYDYVCDDELLRVFPNFNKEPKKYWAWGDCSEDSHIYYIIDHLTGTCKSLCSFEYEYERRGFDTMKLVKKIDEEIFCCAECGWWCEVSEIVHHDDENICVDCFEAM